MISSVHHISLIISKEKNLEFYRNLGFIEVFRKVRSYDTVVLMDGYGMELEIFIDGSHERCKSETLGLRHFALKVSSPLEEEIDKLKEASKEELDFMPIMSDWRGERFFFIKDPDGAVIELHE